MHSPIVPRTLLLPILLVATGGCANAAQPPADQSHRTEEKASAATAPARSAPYTNDYLAFTWSLPPSWQWRDFDPSEIGATGIAEDVVGATPKEKSEVFAVVLATDYPSIVPGVRNEERPDYLQNLEGSLKARAKVWQLQIESSAPLEFNQNKGWKLTGTRGQWPKRWSMIGFHTDRRGFVLWCEFTEPNLEEECSKAFLGLEIKEQAPELAGPTELREGFVLDDPQVGCTYTPPGSGWVGRGPRLGGEGATQTWTWAHQTLPQVEVGIIPLAPAHASLTIADLGEGFAENFRERGSDVTVGQTKMGGKPAALLQLNGPKLVQDWIMVKKGAHAYTLLITYPNGRRKDFVKEALKGFALR